jgi:CheY-like chemotaxis protein
VERVKDRDYDVVLMDLHMPDGDGVAATRAIRALPDLRRAAVPILAVSASMRMAEPHEIDAAGFTEFVGKPVNPDVLFTKISRYLRAEA